MSNRRVNSITYGAMMTALLGVLLFVNRQLAGLFDLYMFWIIPIPVIIYCLKFSISQAVIMGVSMIAISFIIATPVTVFYVAASIIAGLVYSRGLKKGYSGFQLILSVFAISLLVAILSTFVFAKAFGYDLAEEIRYITETINEISSTLGPGFTPEYFTSRNFIMTIIVISTVVTSIMEGILVHLLAFIVLRRLKMETPPMKPLGHIMCPKWLRFIVFVIAFAYGLSIITGVRDYDEIITVLMSLVYVVCMFFGYLLILTVLAWKIPDPKKRTVMLLPIALVSMLVFPILLTIGFIDIFSNVRQNIIKEITANVQQDRPS